jgi:PAS domain S-box-containing protein
MVADRTGYRIAAPFERLLKHLKGAIPEGKSLPDSAWEARHRGILVLLWLHVIGVVCFGLLMGEDLEHSLVEGSVLVPMAIAAGWQKSPKKFRASIASLGLITASAILIHLSGGYIELHFHFFVMLAIIVLYQDWFPFLLAIGYVFFHHGVVGVLNPGSVYNHPDAFAYPWKWAAIHGGFVLAASIANIVSWRINEVLRAYSELILNSTGEGIIGLDLQGKITFMNPAAAQMTGYQVEELRGQPLAGILRLAGTNGVHPFENQNSIRTLTEAGPVQSAIEGTFWHKSGAHFIAEYITTPIRQAGSVVGSVVAFKDVTERIQAQIALQNAKDELEIRVAERTAELEEANIRLRFELAERRRAEEALAKRAAELEESRNFLDSIIENVPAMLFTKDARDLSFVRFNQAGATLLGVDPADMIGKNDYDLFPRAEADFFIATDREALVGGKLIDIPEESIHTAHNGVRLLHTRKVAICGADGTPRYLLGISEDITERKQVEAALRQSEEQTRLIINTALDAVITMDAAGLITDWNTQAETIFGWSRREIIGQPLSDTIIPPQHREAHEHGLKYFLDTGEGPLLHRRIEITALRRDGHEFPIELSISPLRLGEIHIFSAFVRDITTRKQAQADLRDSEARYKAIATTMPGAIYQFTSRDGVWAVDYVAPQILELFGIDPEETLQDLNNFIKHIYLDDLPRFMESVVEAIENLTPWDYEGRLINPLTGELIWWHGLSMPVSTTSGEVVFNGILLNITERKQAEAALIDSEARYKAITTTMPGAIYQFTSRDSVWTVDYMAPQTLELFGVSAEDFMADINSFINHIHPDDLPRFMESVVEAIENLTPWDYEGRLINPLTGELVWWHGMSTPVATTSGEVVFNGILLDITERKQAEAALRQSEQRFRQVVSSISDHIYVTELTQDGQYLNLYMSPHIEPLSGYPVEKFMVNWNFWPSTLIHPDDQPDAAAQAERLAMGQNSELEYRMIRADGNVIWVRDSGRVEKDVARQSLIIYGLVSDITERKQAEAALALARDQALESSRLKTELLAKVSHELRTPLGAILGFTELLELHLDGPDADKQRHMTAEIIDSTHYLTNMVNELLDQAQLDAGRLELNIHPFAPAELLDDALTRMSLMAETKGLSLTGDLAPAMPVMLTGDVIRLQQILVNLISNAIKFTAAGGVQVRFYHPNADHWAIQISDTGTGIPVEAQTYIFEPFRQVDGSITREHTGTGLGLSIVKQLTGLMGGEITLDSTIGQGSTFTIVLPIQPIEEKIA